ncbi:MAG TPA: ascorbate-dependent monooxygenase [Thermoanaerobaculia bacterium]|nr:ascorbate-dependent monooxygenase [Thermoanaerobaculia bacterium]
MSISGRLIRNCFILSLLLLSSSILVGSRRRAVDLPRTPTFNREVIRIVQETCQSCHQTGELGPFPLITYQDAVKWAGRIHFMVSTRQMPPWKPEPGCGEFVGNRRLTDREISLIVDWIEGGMPEGRAEDLPPPRTFETGWLLGPPDAEIAIPQPYTPPDERDMFRCFVLPVSFPEDRYLRAIDFLPLARETVHHIIAYIDTSGEAERLQAADPDPGYESFGGPGFDAAGLLGGWFPGAAPPQLPDEVGILLPANAKIVLQIHYAPHHGHAMVDQTRMGLYFTRARPDRLFRFLSVENRDFTIPAGATDYRVTASMTLPSAIRAITAGTHMHLLGRQNRMIATLPDGEEMCLIRIDDWDIHWQGMYSYADPPLLPAGTVIRIEAEYDNSAANPKNPTSPPRDVSYGEEAASEMCIGYIGYVEE